MSTDERIEKIYNLAKEQAIALFDGRLLSVYLMGSLSHGGFSHVASDIDVAFILDGNVTENDWKQFSIIDEHVKGSNLEFSDRLSVFWSTLNVLSNETTSGAFPAPTKTQGIFPPFDILDLCQNGRLIYGKEVRSMIKVPDINTLFISGVEFLLSYVNTAERNEYLKKEESFSKLDPVKISKTILFPTRLLFTLLTGKIGSNDDAVNYFLTECKIDEHVETLIQEAMLIRNGKEYSKSTLHANHKYLKDYYIQLIDINEDKMTELGNEKYATMLKRWKKELEK